MKEQNPTPGTSSKLGKLVIPAYIALALILAFFAYRLTIAPATQAPAAVEFKPEKYELPLTMPIEEAEPTPEKPFDPFTDRPYVDPPQMPIKMEPKKASDPLQNLPNYSPPAPQPQRAKKKCGCIQQVNSAGEIVNPPPQPEPRNPGLQPTTLPITSQP